MRPCHYITPTLVRRTLYAECEAGHGWLLVPLPRFPRNDGALIRASGHLPYAEAHLFVRWVVSTIPWEISPSQPPSKLGRGTALDATSPAVQLRRDRVLMPRLSCAASHSQDARHTDQAIGARR